MRISDWSSDVCSSDLVGAIERHIVRMMLHRERHFDLQRLEPHGDARQDRTRQIPIFLDQRQHVADDAQFLLDPAFVISRLIGVRSEEHTSELQSLMRISYAVFCLKKKTNKQHDALEIKIL